MVLIEGGYFFNGVFVTKSSHVLQMVTGKIMLERLPMADGLPPKSPKMGINETLAFMGDLPRRNAAFAKDAAQATERLNQTTKTMRTGINNANKSLNAHLSRSNVTMAVVAGIGTLAALGIADHLRKNKHKSQPESWVARVEQERLGASSRQR